MKEEMVELDGGIDVHINVVQVLYVSGQQSVLALIRPVCAAVRASKPKRNCEL